MDERWVQPLSRSTVDRRSIAPSLSFCCKDSEYGLTVQWSRAPSHDAACKGRMN